jgi:hypothetical protein
MIRAATLTDIPALVEMGARMHAERVHQSRLPYRTEKVSSLLYQLMTGAEAIVLVAPCGEELAGCAIAVISTEWYSDAHTANELVLFVDAAHRGSSTIAAMLIAGLDAWAQAKNVAQLSAGSRIGCDAELQARLYERMGFQRTSIGLERFYGVR